MVRILDIKILMSLGRGMILYMLGWGSGIIRRRDSRSIAEYRGAADRGGRGLLRHRRRATPTAVFAGLMMLIVLAALAGCQRSLKALEDSLGGEIADARALAALAKRTSVVSDECASPTKRQAERLRKIAARLIELNERFKRGGMPRGSKTGSELSAYSKVKLQIGVGNQGEQAALEVRLPHRAGRIATPDQLMAHVEHAWDTVVAPHQAGLTEAKATALAAAPLTAGEAWHHYEATGRGVVDSARLLVAFGVVPSLQSGGTRLHAAAARGDLDGVKAILDSVDERADVDERAADGTTPLHAAAAMGQAEVVALLLAEGAAADAVGSSGATALMVAASMGHVEVALALLAGGADADAAHAFASSTALHFAAEMGQARVIEALCASGADANSRKRTGGTPLHTAADCDQPSSIRALLGAPCAADHTLLLNGDTTALYLAAQRGFVNASAALLDGGADVNFVMPTGTFGGQLSVPGQDAPSPNGYYPERNTEVGNGATALHAAVENGHLALASVLLSRGARQTDSMEGATPLIIALQYHHPAIALELLRAKPTPSIDHRVPRDGSSALFVAAGAGYTEVVQELLRLGANPDLANRHGASPLSHAALRGQVQAMRLLLEAGASPNVGTRPSAGGGGALHAALVGRALRGKSLARALGWLLAAGADVTAVDAKGLTALHVSQASPPVLDRRCDGGPAAARAARAAADRAPRVCGAAGCRAR